MIQKHRNMETVQQDFGGSDHEASSKMCLLVRLALLLAFTVSALASISSKGLNQDSGGYLRSGRSLSSLSGEAIANRPWWRRLKIQFVSAPEEVIIFSWFFTYPSCVAWGMAICRGETVPSRSRRDDSTGQQNVTDIALEYPQVDGWRSNIKVQHIELPNIMFVKAHKVGSTSMMNHIRLIAARNGGHPDEYMYEVPPDRFYGKLNEQPLTGGMHIWTNHAPLAVLLHRSEDAVIKDSFKFTMVRDPLDRCLSAFYYYDASIKDHGWSTYTNEQRMLMKMETKSCAKRGDKETMIGEVEVHKGSTVEEIMDFYDLVGITALFMETLAIIKMVLGLRYGDMLSFNGKTSHKRIPLSEEPQEVLDHFSDLIDKEDVKLYLRANQALDKVIKKLQPDFTEVHKTIQWHLVKARDKCEDVMSPVLTNGFGCYRDGSCRVECLNNYSTSKGLWVLPKKRYSL
ncbi:unnamed protein product [Discosporangium mesarthrocarpum]